uniref:CUB domain-containing protein n=1 Tax=Rhabditophanes sp. KR3021 TaxID=114890 RepID=A0AC35U7G5_9BILA
MKLIIYTLLTLVTLLNGADVQDAKSCKEGFKYENQSNHCFFYSESLILTFSEAENYCKSKDAVLTIFNSPQKIDLAKNMINVHNPIQSATWISSPKDLVFNNSKSKIIVFKENANKCSMLIKTNTGTSIVITDCHKKQPFICRAISLGWDECPQRIFTAPSGTLHSPYYPDNYLTEQTCYYFITVEPKYIIELEFNYFETEANCDHLWIYEKGSTDGESDYDYSGFYYSNTNSLTVRSRSNRLSLKFHSDWFRNYNGFEATYKTVG